MHTVGSSIHEAEEKCIAFKVYYDIEFFEVFISGFSFTRKKVSHLKNKGE